MIDFTSAKSTLIRPGSVISSEMPWMPWRSTSSTTPNAASSDVRLSITDSSRSLGMVISVLTFSLRSLMPCSAASRRRAPSKVNGLVTTPTVSAPTSRAMDAITGEAPVPVPPPMPAAMNTMSAPRKSWNSDSALSSAALAPTCGLPPAPSPRVSFSPMRSRFGESERASACASVLTVTNSTPRTPAWIIRFTAFEPPPPTPITMMRAVPSSSTAIGRLRLSSRSHPSWFREENS